PPESRAVARDDPGNARAPGNCPGECVRRKHDRYRKPPPYSFPRMKEQFSCALILAAGLGGGFVAGWYARPQGQTSTGAARANSAEAEAAVQKLPLCELRTNALAKLASALAQTDGPAAVAMMERLKLPPRDWAWRSLFRSWAANDPVAASTSLATMPRQVA